MKKLFTSIWQLLRGHFTVLAHAFKHRVTLEYPEKKAELNSRFRGQLNINIDKCIACGTCQKACPCVGALEFKKAEPNEEKPAKPYAESFSIDTAQCIFCGNCVENCPTHALFMTDKYELANYDKKELKLVVTKSTEGKSGEAEK